MNIGDRRSVPDKLIDRWTYKVKDVEIERLDRQPGCDSSDFDEKYKRRVERVRNKLVTVKVYMCRTTLQSEEPPHPLDTVSFRLRVPELELTLDGTDIASLKDAVWSMLDTRYAVNWERYYRVEIVEPYVADSGTGLSVSYDDVYKGTTWNGKHLLKFWRGHEYRIAPWPGAFKDEKGKVMACILATEANRLALQEFCSRVDTLREKLAEFLRPEVIQKNLAALAGLALLPPAPPQNSSQAQEKEETYG